MNQDTLAKLYYAYRHPSRHYHDINHITDGFTAIQEAKDNGVVIDDEAALRYAWWWHDKFYDTTKSDALNVDMSANEAVEDARAFGHSEDFCSKVHRFIMVTKHTKEFAPVTNDEKLMVDIDLLPLAVDDFPANTQKVRLEYPQVPDETFYPARKAILKNFIKTPMYHTPYFESKYGDKARKNLTEATA